MSGFAGYLTRAPLEIQILLINFFGLISSVLNWNWLEWDQQLKKIWNLTVSQFEKSDANDTDWIKTILSRIVLARFFIKRILLPAYLANLYATLKRNKQNLLIFWMVLSFVKNIILEIGVIVIIFMLWRKGNIPTLLLAEFIVEKTICLILWNYKWYTTFKWYIQLQREAKMRKLTIIAWRDGIAYVPGSHVPGRIGYSLDDERLSITIARRSKYASLLNLDELPEESSCKANFDQRTSKSVTSLMANDIHDWNVINDDPIANDLSVAEKSMRVLGVTAEGVMDARARIQERSYRQEGAATIKTIDSMKNVISHISAEKIGETTDALKDGQITTDTKGTIVDLTLSKEDIMKYSPIEKERENDDSKIVSTDSKQEVPTEKQIEVIDFSRIRDGSVSFVKEKNRAKPTELSDFYAALKKSKKEEAVKTMKIVQYSSSESARRLKTKPRASIVRRMKEKLCSIHMGQQIDMSDWERYPCLAQTRLHSTGSNMFRKERYKSPETSSYICHCSSYADADMQKNDKRYMRSRNIDEREIVKRDAENRKNVEKNFAPSIVTEKNEVNEPNSASKYSENRLKKKIQMSQECPRKRPVTWHSVSLARTARSSGYTKKFVAADKYSVCENSVQTETFDELKNFSNERYGLKHAERTWRRRLVDLRSVHNATLLKERNYTRYDDRETTIEQRAPKEAYNDAVTSVEKKIRNLFAPSRKQSIEKRKALERKALRYYNRLTLLKDKKELEARRKHGTLLNNERSMKKEPGASEMEILKTNDLTSLENEKERKIEAATKHNFPSSCKESAGKLKIYNELILSKDKEVKVKCNLAKSAILPRYVEDFGASTSASNQDLEVSKSDDDGNTINIPEIRQDANSNVLKRSNDCETRRARMSLNLREITRNIEWILHPEGIILVNKYLSGRFNQFSEDERFRESRQRDIVDDNIASTLHGAFFFKPEIIRRIFRRVQTKISDSSPSFRRNSWREDLGEGFVCRANNETAMFSRDRDSFLDFGLESSTASRSDLRNSMLPVGEENARDLCIFIEQREDIPDESETAIMEDSSLGGSQENARANISIFGENRADGTTNDNLRVRSIVDISRDLDIRVSEGSAQNMSIEQIKENENIINMNNDPSPDTFDANDINSDEQNDKVCDKILLNQTVDIDNATINDESNEINCGDYSNNVDDVNSSVRSIESESGMNERYFSAIDINLENKIHNNNLFFDATRSSNLETNYSPQIDVLNNKIEKNMSNCIVRDFSKIFPPSQSSYIESDNRHASILRANDEKFKKWKQLSDIETVLNNRGGKLGPNSRTKSDDKVSRFHDVEIFKLRTTVQGSARSKEESTNIYEKTNELSTSLFYEMHLNRMLQQDDSFDSMYERNDDNSETPISLEEGSLMEEFSDDIDIITEDAF